MVDRTALEADLAAYYDREAEERHGRELSAERVERRAAYARLLEQEDRRSLIEVGCGPGGDGVVLRAAGLTYRGVDLAPASVRRARQAGLHVDVASVHALPYADGAFEAGWTMSTLLHVPDTDLQSALTELHRVLQPGAPLALGVWGARASREEQWVEDNGLAPRFFSLRSDQDLRTAVERFFAVEQWHSWPGAKDLHYQWLLLRRR